MAGFIDPSHPFGTHIDIYAQERKGNIERQERNPIQEFSNLASRIQMELTEALRKIEELTAENASLKAQLVPLTDSERIALLESKIKEMTPAIQCLEANVSELFKRTRGNAIYGASNV